MSTRICVKNIPRYITDEKLREHFAQKGEVTDAKIIRTRDGRTRQFGFVGFRTADEADEAVKYFHRTFFDTSRLTCEIAQQIGSQDLPRPWSRHSEGSSSFKKTEPTIEEDSTSVSIHPNKGAAAQADEGNNPNPDNDAELQEFLQLMQPRSKTKIWANDTTGVQGTGVSQKKKKGDKSKTKVEVKTVDTFARRVPINKGKNSEKLTQFHVRFDDESGSEDEEAEMEAGPILDREIIDEEGEEKLAVVEKDELVNNDLVSDMQYLNSRVKGNWSEDDDDDDDGGQEEPAKEGVQEDQDESISEGDESSQDEIEEVGHVEETGPELVMDVDETKESTPLDLVGHGGGEHAIDTVDAKQQEHVSETGRLFVRNLPYTASEEDLKELFSEFGQLSQVHLVLDKETNFSKGFAYILFMLPEDAVRAMEKLDKSIFQGRLLHILAAKRPPPAPEPKLSRTTGTGTTKYKIEREAQRKAAEASGDTRAWNTLYMRPDTVAENVARKYGMTKSEFLDPEAGDLAVRMALGETHIIAETKRALSNEGVDVEVLEEIASGCGKGQLKRSDCVILVKNLPFTTSEEDLIRMFSVHGTIGRIILPPTRTLAMVEYLEAAEARKAFKSLAYKRYQHVPLYLEWAPVNLLTDAGPRPAKTGAMKTKVSTKAVGQDLVKRAEVEQKLIGLSDDDADSTIVQARSLFVKNLNFSTTQKGLKKHFEQHIKTGSIKSATIKSKPSKKGKALSMGFGFVELDSMETAVEVRKQLQGTVLDGHALVLQVSHSAKRGQADSNKVKESMKGEKGQSSTKVIVRNVAFEATRKDLQQLFSPFGQIKSLRLPKKFDGKHRGFAFIEYMTKQEAANAFDGLKSTHLYGRHLVLERAKVGESLDELRARTAQQFFAENGVDTSNDRLKKKRKTMSSVNDSNSAFEID